MGMRNTLIGLGAVVLVAAVAAILWATGLIDEYRPQGPFFRASLAGRPSASLPEGLELATFGGGCFWCTEAVFQNVKGVESVVSGYSGGSVKNPTYEEVCSRSTGHAEVIQVVFDPKVVSYADILDVFFETHDPTSLNRQGNDVGPQYRSVIFYHSEAQRAAAEQAKKKVDDSRRYVRPAVTEIAPYTAFYPAEDYHQNFYRDNARHPYCKMVIRPKLDKFEETYKDKEPSPH
jgi:peptide-methionine (S)-S-oxide reductase